MSKEITRLEAGKRMSPAVICGDMVYLAGEVGDGPDVTAQALSALAEVDRLLALSGTSKSRILTTTVYLANMGDYAAMNAEVLTDLAGGSFEWPDLDLSWLEWPDIDLSSLFDWFDWSP